MPPKPNPSSKIEEDITTLKPRECEDEEMREVVEESFEEGTLSQDWKVLATQKAEDDCLFLCLDWALIRLNQMFGNYKKIAELLDKSHAPSETTGYNPVDFIKALNVNGNDVLRECDLEDEEAVVIAWSAGWNPKHPFVGSVGHVQVKYQGNWESKPSLVMVSITHGREDFKHFDFTPRLAACRAYTWKHGKGPE